MAKKKKELKAKEPIKLRFKELVNGNKSIYLDCYVNGKRTYEFLKMYIVPEASQTAKVQNQNTLQAANAIKAQKLQDLYNGEAGLSKSKGKGKMLLLDWMAIYQADQAKKGKKDNWQISFTIKLLTAYKGTKVRLLDVDKAFCLGYLDYIQNVYVNPRNGENLKPVTAQNYYRVLNCALNAAIRAEVITQNPFSKVGSTDKIKVPESPREYLTIDEVKRMIATDCPRPEIKQAFLFSCFCGLRISDIETLLWKDICKDGNQYRIDKVMIKTGQPLYLPLSTAALKWMPERGTQAADAYVFDLPKGSNIRNKVVQDWAAAANITKHVTFHVARHTFATMMLTLGADLYTTSKLLGHTDVQTTQIYAKIVNQKKDEAVNLVNGIFD